MNLQESLPDLLLACLRQVSPADLHAQLAKLTPEQWQQLLDLATEHAVPSLLSHRLKLHGAESLMPPDIRQALQKSYYGVALRNMQLYRELGKITAAFQTQGVPSLVLKGAHLAADVYETIALRSMSDIDILVQQADIPVAIEQMQALGYQPTAPLLAPEAYLDYRHHLPPFVHHNGITVVEIHWTITSTRRSYRISMQDLWARSVPLTLTNITTQGFCPVDLLLHVCMHATYQHQLRQGIRFLCDIAEIVKHYGDGLDWDAVVQRATAWQWQKGVCLALYATQRLLGAQIPTAIIERLNPTAQPLPDLQKLKARLLPANHLEASTSSHTLFTFLRTPSWLSKLQLLKQRIFLPRNTLAVIYSVTPGSPWLSLYYGVRLKDLLSHHLHKIWRYGRGDQQFVNLASQQVQLQEWLE